MKILASLAMTGLLMGCSSWPSGSYVQMASDNDSAVLAPAIAECTVSMLPPNTAVTVQPPLDRSVITEIVSDEMIHHAVILQPNGRVVTYVVAPLDTGTFISVSSAPNARCGQYFSRASGSLRVNGPMMVLQ